VSSSEETVNMKPTEHAILDLITVFLLYIQLFNWFNFEDNVKFFLSAIILLLVARTHILSFFKKILFGEKNTEHVPDVRKSGRPMSIIDWCFMIMFIFAAVPWSFLDSGVRGIIGYFSVVWYSAADIRSFFEQFHSCGEINLFSKTSVYFYLLVLFGVSAIIVCMW
jgi:hypothetical protein